MKRICVVTATRAEYGLLRRLIGEIQSDTELELSLIVTGTHLLLEYGETVREIEADGFPISEKVPVDLDASTPENISRTMGSYFYAFANVFLRCHPDCLVVLGDRYELLPICFCAVNSGVPIAHISGGDTTEGAIDELIRHCITKISWLHFPGCKSSYKRIIQLGEDPDRVFNLGDPGVENARKMSPLTREELSQSIGFSLDGPYFSVTFHPVTTEPGHELVQLNELLAALDALPEYRFLITKANADAGGESINRELEHFAASRKNCLLVASLGAQRYLSSLRHAEGIIGNSSSGIVEAPCFGIPTIDIGNRQRGRDRAESVINCPPERDAILQAIHKSQTPEFRAMARQAKNPYGEGDTAREIVAVIKRVFTRGKIDLKKKFYNIPFKSQL